MTPLYYYVVKYDYWTTVHVTIEYGQPGYAWFQATTSWNNKLYINDCTISDKNVERRYVIGTRDSWFWLHAVSYSPKIIINVEILLCASQIVFIIDLRSSKKVYKILPTCFLNRKTMRGPPYMCPIIASCHMIFEFLQKIIQINGRDNTHVW